MSKNFAEEYKTLANEELPDLWNRVEAGLTPKATALVKEETIQEAATQDAGQAKREEAKEKPEKGKVISFLSRYRTAVAAAVCVAVILPAVMVMGRTAKSGGYESAADNAAPAKAFDTAEALAEEAAVTEDAMDTAAADNGGMWDEAAAEASEEAETAAGAFEEAETESEAGSTAQEGWNGSAALADEADGAADMARGDLVKELESALSGEVKKSQQNSAAKEESSETATIYEKVSVKAVKQTGEMKESEKDVFFGVKMQVVADPSGTLAEGTQITVWIAASSSRAYVTGGEYVLDLSYDPDRECPYQAARTY